MFKHIIRINGREWFENNYPLLTLAELYTRFPVEYNGSGTTTIIYRFTLLKFTETTRNYSHQLNNPYTILETIFLTSLNQRRRPNPVSHPSPWLKLHSQPIKNHPPLSIENHASITISTTKKTPKLHSIADFIPPKKLITNFRNDLHFKLHSQRRSKIIHLPLSKTASITISSTKKTLSCIPLPISSLLRN